MNKRIEKLAKQAREYANSKEPYEKIKNKAWIDVYDEKFAELIVRECIEQGKQIQLQLVSNGSEEYNTGREMGIEVFLNQIKRTFRS